MQQPKNIIFDFGGVFIDVDYNRTEQAFVNAGITHFHQLYSQQAASPLFEQLETGKLSPADFFNAFRQITGSSLSNENITHCWNGILGQYYTPAIEKLRSLRERYRVFLYSNTNIIHYHCFKDIYTRQFGKWDFNELFEKAYYSHEIGLRKPYKESYEWVLQDAGIVAAETLFIDDTLLNIEGAKQAGLATIYLAPPLRLWQLEL